MKYQYSEQTIPMEARQELNDKILYLIEQNTAEQYGITKEDVFNAYTGDGGLHGLERADYDSYAAFADAKKEVENGQFFTPPPLCELIMNALEPSTDETVADLTMGMGTFCNYTPLESNFYGCELDIKSCKVACYLYPNANITHQDIRLYQPDAKFDYVVGNPPFNLKWNTERGETISQMYYCLKAAELMKPLGIMALIVPASFLSDEYMDKLKIAELEKRFRFLGQVSIPDTAFSALGVRSFRTKIMFWQRFMKGEEPDGRYHFTDDLTLDSLNDTDSILPSVRELIRPAKERMKENRARVKLLSASNGKSDFQYQVRKMLWHIQSDPKLVDKYSKCMEYLYKFEHQKQPEGMSYEEWRKVRITEPKVLAYLRRTLKSRNKKPAEDVVRLVKQDYGLVYKAYSAKARLHMEEGRLIPVPLYRITAEHEDPRRYGDYAAMIRRRQRDYDRETKPFADMEPDAEIGKFLDGFTVYDNENEEQIYLNAMQKRDLNLILQKRYHLLQWEQGSGKTLAGITVGTYRMECQGARNTWVVSTAISVKNNWDTVLKSYSLPYRMIRKLSDLEQVKDGEFVIITLNMLCKYRKQIKKHLRMRNRNVCMVLDESDEMSNPDSKRTKAILDCFRRVKFKLAMTGTSTRNNISEIAPQLELLYNNSHNMISRVSTLYSMKKDKDSGDIRMEEDENPYEGEPIPAYKAGYRLFMESHSPERTTVFGVSKRTQDIYNADELNRMLSYSVLTRTFEEVTGKDIRRLHQVLVKFSPEERMVYQKAINEFYAMRERYFASTGDSRKDSMMALIQQITLLLRISAAPDTMEEYSSDKVPVKIQKVLSMLADWNDEIVVIGVRHKNVVDAYARRIRERFPDRKLFVVTGSTTTLAGRRKLRETLKNSGNGILLCTQQCLPSSVNFEFVNKVIIPELHYNNARMSQFYFRFIRYTSTDWKDVYFVTYSGSIESNQMQMVLAKEKLNLFMKGQDVDLDEVYERFGVDYDLMSLLMSREEDENGRFHISWGEQNIA